MLSGPLRQQGLQLGDGGTPRGLGLLEPPPGTGPGLVRAATFATWPEEVGWIADQVVAARESGTAPHWADVAILTRRNADIAPLYAELTARDVPVEIVGLGGLLQLPEVMDVTATLRVVDDVTANPDLIRLLTGPRWRIGPRDLALLGRRARELSGGASSRPAAASENAAETAGPDRSPVLADLEQAVADVDPTEVVSLLDAVENPGELPYSDAARARFAAVAAELRDLRQHAGEPVLDLTRRVITTIGLDVELMATPELARANRRDQLGAFLDAVAEYVDVDGDASLTGLLAYLQAEIEQGPGLEQAVPSDREAVKLLTVHKAKGLEWEVVFLPALMTGVFPSDRVTDNWVTNPAVLPADLRGDADSIPQLPGHENADLGAYKRALADQQIRAEDRLAYVAATRARQVLIGSGHPWRSDLIRPRTPSTYLKVILDEADRQGELVAEAPEPGAANPLITEAVPVPWPAPLDPDAQQRREWAAAEVHRNRSESAAGAASTALEPLLLDVEEVVAGWDADIDRLVAEAREDQAESVTVELPSSLSASAVVRLGEDPQLFAAELARPMPRPPSRAARFGTRFHAWVEHYLRRLAGDRAAQLPLLDDGLDEALDDGFDDGFDEGFDEGSDEGFDDDGAGSGAGGGTGELRGGGVGPAALRTLSDAFVAGRFGQLVPAAVEMPFTLLIGGRLVRGRMDAVYATDPAGPGADLVAGADHDFVVVDWKTGRSENADPLQLALYRQAWAELQGIPPERVGAAFYDVRTDRLSTPALPDAEQIVQLLTGSS